MKRIFSGIQPSGSITLGNYLGAIKQFIKLQYDYECFYCVVDLHAITVDQDPKELRQNSHELASLYLACGLDPNKTNIFIQSDVKGHLELTWIMQTLASMGELERMTQYKEKSSTKRRSVALFTYPTLMAADVLLYDTNIVPVGDDQKQHIEVTRDWAERFNARYGETFVIPELMLNEHGSRIMDLQDPSKKMSKSSENKKGTIFILDDLEKIKTKIKKAVTDSEGVVRYDVENKPAVSNLMTIYGLITNKTMQDIETEFDGQNYGVFKQKLSEVIIDEVGLIQKNYQEIIATNKITDVLAQGARNADKIASKNVKDVFTKVGLGR